MSEIPPIPIEFGTKQLRWTWQVWVYTLEKGHLDWRLISTYTKRDPAAQLVVAMGHGPVKLVKVETSTTYQDEEP